MHLAASKFNELVFDVLSRLTDQSLLCYVLEDGGFIAYSNNEDYNTTVSAFKINFIRIHYRCSDVFLGPMGNPSYTPVEHRRVQMCVLLSSYNIVHVKHCAFFPSGSVQKITTIQIKSKISLLENSANIYWIAIIVIQMDTANVVQGSELVKIKPLL